MTSRITAYERPIYFRDSMVRGAFAHLEPDHQFAEDGRETVMRDVFEFRAPLDVVGRVAERLVLRSYLQRLLEERNREIKAVAESTSGGSSYRRSEPREFNDGDSMAS
ncbi:MAG: SRPBCC family protein [Candidatus Rokuibacteriota bacterium]